MYTMGRALAFFGVLGLVTLGIYAFMDTADSTSVWQIAFSVALMVLGAVLMLMGHRKKRDLPDGYMLVAEDLALPMGGWSITRMRGFTRGSDTITTASLREPTPDLASPDAVAEYVASVATQMSSMLVTHELVTIGDNTRGILMQMEQAEACVAQVLVPRDGVTQIIAVSNRDLTQAGKTARWVVSSLLDLRK